MRNSLCPHPAESHGKAQQNPFADHCAIGSPHAVLASSFEPELLEAWLEQVRSNCHDNGLQGEGDLVYDPIDRIDSCQTRHLPQPSQPETSLEAICGPSSGLFVPSSPCFLTHLDSSDRQTPGQSDPILLQESGACQPGRSSHGLDPGPVPKGIVSHETRLEFQRQSRRKTREDRYDTKAYAAEDQESHDRLKRQRHSHRNRRRHKLRSRREIMKNFTSEAVSRENVIMKPRIAGGLLSKDPDWNNNILADLSFHDFELGRPNSQTKREFRKADIDSTSRRSNILPNHPTINTPIVRTSHHNTAGAHLGNEASLYGPGQLREISNMDALAKSEDDGMDLEPDLGRNTPLGFGYRPIQGYNSPPGQEDQCQPCVRNGKHYQNSELCRSPATYGQPCSSYFGAQLSRDQDTREILPTGICHEAHLPRLSVWEDHDDTLVQSPDREDGVQPNCNAYRSHGPVVGEPVNSQLKDLIDGPLSHTRLPVRFSRWESPVARNTSFLDWRSSRNLVHVDGQLSCEHGPAKMSAQLVFGTIPVSPMRRAEQAASCVGQMPTQASRNTAPRTKAQFTTEKTPDPDGMRHFGTANDQANAHGKRTRAQTSYDSSPPRFWPRFLPGQSQHEQYRGSTCSRDLEDHSNNSYLRRSDGTLHTLKDTTSSTCLASVSCRRGAGYTENEPLTSLGDELHGGGMRQTTLEVQELPYSSRERSNLSPPYNERHMPIWMVRSPVFVDNDHDDDGVEMASFWKPHYLA